MVYTFKRNNENEFLFQNFGLCEPRAYFIPASRMDICRNYNAENALRLSDRAFSLAGEWELAEINGNDVFDTEGSEKKSVTVPSVFSVKKSATPNANEDYVTYAFFRKFDVFDTAKKHTLNFFGVQGDFEIYINGQFCGKSVIGFGEFDISDFIVKGENELLVKINNNQFTAKVTGENADAIGICGDVVLLIRERAYLEDYMFTSKGSEFDYEGKFAVKVKTAHSTTVEILLNDGNKTIEKTTLIPDDDGTACFEFKGAFKTYSTENPYLYTAFVRILERGEELECTSVKIGFSEANIEKGVFYFGDTDLKIRGVRYNALNKENGAYKEISEYKEDLKFIKEMNANAVYVKCGYNPSFTELCKEIGLYIIKEFPVEMNFDGLKAKEKEIFVQENAIAYMKSKIIALYMSDASAVNIAAYAFGNISEEGSLKEEIFGFEKISNRPVIGGENGLKYIDNGDPTVIGDAIASSDVPVLFTVSAFERTDKFMELVLSEDKIAGMIADGFTALIEENVSDEETSVYLSDRGILLKYAYRPFVAHLADNRTLVITSLRDYTDSSDITISLVKYKGELSKKIKDCHIIIAPRGTREIDVYLGEIIPDTKLYVRFLSGDRLIATEIIKVEEEKEMPEYIKALQIKKYTYTVNNREFTLDKLSENMLPPRSYFVPCSGEVVCDIGDYPKSNVFSDRMFSLSGEWDFAYFEENAPTEFTVDGLNWKEITLPSSWEQNGYGKLEFNDGYPFKYNIKKSEIEENGENKNAVGIYRRIINIGDTSYNHILSFDKISGSAEIHINGKYIGYTILGRGEFDITDSLVIGENELIIIVKKWTPASCLQGSGGFNASGITGDINLIKRRACGLKDYRIVTKKQGSDYLADMKFVFGKAADSVKIELKKNGITLFEKTYPEAKEEIELNLSGTFTGYSDERPEQYDVYVKVFESTFVTECTKIRFGFNRIDINGNILYSNDTPLKLHGITYNAEYDEFGNLLTFDGVKRDLRLIKAYGFNAVAPLHSVAPSFIALCAEIGLYIVADSGVNTKGAGKANAKLRNSVIEDASFANVIKETVTYGFERDKNATNIVCYQIREDGNVPVIADCYKLLKERTEKPVFTYGNEGDANTVCYPSLNEAIDIINESMDKKPVFFIKYASGEGIGCANIREYEDIIKSAECCMGGCVAHFVDDAIGSTVGKENGIFTSDRRAYPCADSIRYIYRPVHSVLSESTDILEITNNRRFASTSDMYVDLCILRNGKTLSRTRIYIDIPAGETRKYDVFHGHIEGDMYINVEYHKKSSGEIMFIEQHKLNETVQTFDFPKGEKALDINEIFDYLDITFDSGCVRFSKKLGAIIRYNVMGKDILKADSTYKGGNCFVNNIYRPFIHNLKREYPNIESKTRDFVCEYSKESAVKQVHVNIENLIYINGKESYIVQDKYIVSAGGNIEVFSVLTPLKRGLPQMDCFGKQLRLNNNFGNIYYYGNGETDNYIDMCEHTRVGIFNMNVDKTFELVRSLQECGNRTNVSYAAVRDNDGDGILIVARKVPYQLRVSPYSDKEIYISKKTGIRPSQSGVYVDVNAFVSGIGTDKNGYPLPQYTVSSAEHVLHFDIIPVKGRK